jgi:ATP dependent DNA ligase C terminal region
LASGFRGKQPDVRRMRKLLAPFPSQQYTLLPLDRAHQHLIVNRLNLLRSFGTVSFASTRDLVRAEAFVIGGYIPGAHGFDALLVGVYEKQKLIFVATVKDGFVPRNRDEIFPALKKLRVARCSFQNLPEKRASRWGESLTAEKMNQCRWVTPKLVCQVAFVEWTDAGHLRHCTFVAMRDDKKRS